MAARHVVLKPAHMRDDHKGGTHDQAISAASSLVISHQCDGNQRILNSCAARPPAMARGERNRMQITRNLRISVEMHTTHNEEIL